MSTSDVNDVMRRWAEYAIKTAKEKFNIELDYSENSISKLEGMLEQIYKLLQEDTSEDKTSAYQETATLWGGYLGEVIRQKWDGIWINEGSENILKIRAYKFSPMAYIYIRLKDHIQDDLNQYLVDLSQKMNLDTNSLKNSLPDFESANLHNQANLSKKTNNSEKKSDSIVIDKRVLTAIGIVLGILLIGIGGIAVGLLINKGDISNEFKSDLNSFLAQAEKLNIMTEQGVSNQNFAIQLVEVKSSYAMLSKRWPSSLENEKQLFDQAIKGWDLTHQVWDYGIDEISPVYSNLDWIWMTENMVLLKKVTDYFDYDGDNPEYISVGDWVGSLMAASSGYFEAGKESVNNKIK